jgi:hypothetical protein
MALANEEINAEAERRRKEDERRKKQAPRGQTVAVPRGEVGSFSKAYQGYKFVEEGTPESRRAMNIGEFTEKEAQRRFEEKRGKDWVGQMEARVKESEPQRARKALATVAARNRAMRQEPLPSPLQEDRTLQEINLPGGGRVKFGNKTLAQMREFEAKEKERVGKEQARVAAAQEKIYANRYAEATRRYGRDMDPKKRYAAELAERGLSVPQNRAEEEQVNRVLMEEFLDRRDARASAKAQEGAVVNSYRNYKAAARSARQAGDYQSAALFEQDAEKENIKAGGNITNVTARRKFFEDEAAIKLKNELAGRAAKRVIAKQKQTSTNPEAVVDFSSVPPWMTDFSPKPESYSEFTARTRMPRIPERGAKAPEQAEEVPQIAEEEDRRNRIIQSFDEDTQNTLSRIASLKETIASEPKAKTRTRPTQEQLAIRKELSAEKEKIKAKIKELQGLPGMKTRGASESKKMAQEQISILNQELSFLERL